MELSLPAKVNHNRFATLLAMAFLFAAITSTRAAGIDDPPPLKLSDCPPAVQKTLKAEAKGSSIDKVETDAPYDELEYTARVVIKQRHYAITVAEEGKLIQKVLENDEEKELPFEQCPKAVQRALADEAEGVPIETVEKDTQNGVVSYVAEVQIKDNHYWITVAENGVLLEKALDEDAEDEDDGNLPVVHASVLGARQATALAAHIVPLL